MVQEDYNSCAKDEAKEAYEDINRGKASDGFSPGKHTKQMKTLRFRSNTIVMSEQERMQRISLFERNKSGIDKSIMISPTND